MVVDKASCGAKTNMSKIVTTERAPHMLNVQSVRQILQRHVREHGCFGTPSHGRKRRSVKSDEAGKRAGSGAPRAKRCRREAEPRSVESGESPGACVTQQHSVQCRESLSRCRPQQGQANRPEDRSQASEMAGAAEWRRRGEEDGWKMQLAQASRGVQKHSKKARTTKHITKSELLRRAYKSQVDRVACEQRRVVACEDILFAGANLRSAAKDRPVCAHARDLTRKKIVKGTRRAGRVAHHDCR